MTWHKARKIYNRVEDKYRRPQNYLAVPNFSFSLYNKYSSDWCQNRIEAQINRIQYRQMSLKFAFSSSCLLSIPDDTTRRDVYSYIQDNNPISPRNKYLTLCLSKTIGPTSLCFWTWFSYFRMQLESLSIDGARSRLYLANVSSFLVVFDRSYLFISTVDFHLPVQLCTLVSCGMQKPMLE